MQKSKKQIAVETIDKPENRGGADPARHAKSLEILRSRGFSLSRNPVCTQEQTGSRTYMSEKTAKRNEDNRSLHFHVANFFKFMAANLSFTQFVT